MAKILNNKVYDGGKFTAQVLLPALGTLYFALAGIWGLPDANEVVGTIVAVDTFLGVALQLSTTAYNKSDVSHDGFVTATPAEDIDGIPQNHDLQVTLTKMPEDLMDKNTVRLKVVPPKAG